MFSPATKGWIQKYLELYEQNAFETLHIDHSLNPNELHRSFIDSGLCFGYASSMLQYKTADRTRWTNAEQLKLLLFEAMFTLYIGHLHGKSFDAKEFIEHLSNFYKNHTARSIKKLFTFFLKESQVERVESILAERVGVNQNIIESTFEINNFSNTFIYLDLILYSNYLKEANLDQSVQYTSYVKIALQAVAAAAKADDIIEEREKLILNVFLESANLSKTEQQELEEVSASDLFALLHMHQDLPFLFKRYLLDLAAFVIYSSNEISKKEKIFLRTLSDALGFNKDIKNDSIVEVQRFILQHVDKIHFLKDASGVEKYYSGVSEKWTKILGRNKDKLGVELRQSKELVGLISKSTTQELSKEEKEKVKSQFKDLVKSMPALTIFLLPGGAVLLPIILKVIPSLVPSAFRENELDSDPPKQIDKND
jgi:ribosomal protein L7/L12